MDNDLLRQRRNLIVISSGLLVFDFAQVKITKVSVMGTELVVGNAQVLVGFAWAMWAYFLLRYYQYLRAENDKGIAKEIKNYFNGHARALIFKMYDLTHLSVSIEVNRQGLGAVYSVKQHVSSSTQSYEIHSGKFPQIKVMWWAAKSIFHVVIHTPKVTDHILPFILAISAPVVSAIGLL